MKRREFLAVCAAVSAMTTNIRALAKAGDSFPNTDEMPLLFIGHGNPMNVITDNPYRKSWEQLGKTLPSPAAILCISAHWLTKGTAVTLNESPQTIHDFRGFPPELYQQEYAAPGATDYAQMTVDELASANLRTRTDWGLDHGAWCVLKPMFPAANIPVFQMSIDDAQPPHYHYELGKKLAFLRKKGVLIVASGNIVHNLGKMRMHAETFDWAMEFDAFVKSGIETGDHQKLIDYERLGALARIAHPTNEHYLPLLYALGLSGASDKPRFFNTSFDMGSVSMRSVVFE